MKTKKDQRGREEEQRRPTPRSSLDESVPAEMQDSDLHASLLGDSKPQKHFLPPGVFCFTIVVLVGELTQIKVAIAWGAWANHAKYGPPDINLILWLTIFGVPTER